MGAATSMASHQTAGECCCCGLEIISVMGKKIIGEFTSFIYPPSYTCCVEFSLFAASAFFPAGFERFAIEHPTTQRVPREATLIAFFLVRRILIAKKSEPVP